MKIGFTGTRRGLQVIQYLALKDYLSKIIEPFIGHHGDCQGADAEFNKACVNLRMPVVIHPPQDELHRAWCAGWTEMRGVKTHFARNRDIVNETDLLIACPCDTTDQPKGGTWYTVHYAMKVGKPVVVIWPDGRIERRPADAGTPAKPAASPAQDSPAQPTS